MKINYRIIAEFQGRTVYYYYGDSFGPNPRDCRKFESQNAAAQYCEKMIHLIKEKGIIWDMMPNVELVLV